jgi:hypothetical protein
MCPGSARGGDLVRIIASDVRDLGGDLALRLVGSVRGGDLALRLVGSVRGGVRGGDRGGDLECTIGSSGFSANVSSSSKLGLCGGERERDLFIVLCRSPSWSNDCKTSPSSQLAIKGVWKCNH